MKNLIQFYKQLNAPAKVCTFRKLLISSGILFLSTAFFLLLYKPFGNWLESGTGSIKINLWVSFIVAGTYFVMEYLLGLMYRYTHLKNHFKRWHYLTYNIIIFWVAALVLQVYENYLNQTWSIVFSDVFNLFIKIILVSLFSSLVMAVYILVNIVKSMGNKSYFNTRVFNELPRDTITEKVVIGSETENDMFQLNLFDLYYIQAIENYIEVVYYSKDGFKKKLLRNTLKNVELQLEKTPVVRCHRSYMVNMTHLQRMEGNALGLKLKLRNLDKKVSVSRSYVDEFKKRAVNYFEKSMVRQTD